eukprot:CAMPEP_0197540734 /NCGR_PEP_ID=MMETSP1318-20131121/66761_1 /TAXON_ID=552666 /ORGANISM="Partenskyella glossopodia, Strain RCC365" /LENGTH=34 /DNA_ID= /DNA_START= /DNA_END= /DNA_ORIENTATION=
MRNNVANAATDLPDSIEFGIEETLVIFMVNPFGG